jgi:predicted transcriptional regulator
MSSTALLLMMIFFISLVFLTCAAPYNNNQLLKISKLQIEGAIPFSAWPIFSNTAYDNASALLNQTTRMEIYNFIKSNPGFHFRALANSLNLPIGVLQYHLGLLFNKGLVSTYRNGRYKRYFESKKFTELEMQIISILRNGTSGKILVTLLNTLQITHKDLAAQLEISSQALSWQMNHLDNTGLIQRSVEVLNVKYSLDEKVYTTVSQQVTFLDGAAGRI